jgi:hypothetical protein
MPIDLTPFAAPVSTVLLAFLITMVWPFVRDKVWPEWAKRRRATAKAVKEHDDAEREAEKEMQNRILTAFENNARSNAQLEGTVRAIGDVLGRQTDMLIDVNEDVAGLYAHIGQVRPSRSRRVAAPIQE